MAGTSLAAEPGKPLGEQAQELYDWPLGTLDLVNAPCRQYAWNHWFSEHANDVIHFELAPADLDELNGLIALLSAIEAPVKQVILYPGIGPITLNRFSKRQEGERLPAEFAIGSQPRVDRWFEHLEDGKFGIHQYDQPPRALPPTLSIHVGHDLVELDQLRISPNVKVMAHQLRPDQEEEWGELMAPLRAFAAAHEEKRAEYLQVPEAVRRND
ncbi:MAG: hypothetical protein AAGA25_04495 [Planctomycetota bacterium]